MRVGYHALSRATRVVRASRRWVVVVRRRHMVAVCGVWARACARVVGGARLAIARRDASVVVIIRTREALQVRERVSLSVDTNGRRGEPEVTRRGWSSMACWCDSIS